VDCLTCSISEKVSKPEKEIVEYIQSLGIKNIITSDRSVIHPYELDIYLPDHNLAIEYNGKWFHDETYKDKHYHLMKTNLCNNENIQLIHIFDDEWEFKKDIVKNRLKHILGLNDKHIYARKCIVKEINTKEAKEFCEQYHIQGYGVSSVKLGLYYNNELVSVMTFSKPSVSKGNNKKQGT
jgi:hydroxymethylpyrimidine pyrophosphatase-like HAD family hydrolase